MIKFVLLSAVLVLLTVLVVRTIHLSRERPSDHECKPTDADFIALTNDRLKRFQDALRFETVSYDIDDYNKDALFAFGNFLINSFPTVHKSSSLVEWERVNNYSLLYHIKGSNPALRPYLLMSHLDVVPATNLDVWEAPPFSGDVLNGFIYGRGTIDVKQCVMGIMEATEYLLSSGIKPARSYYIAFGHDEEVRGKDGARMLAKRLGEKGVTELEFISDEGLVVTDGIAPGVTKPCAGIGVSEKGQVILKLSVEDAPGHSSMPRKESTIGILARAVHRLESNPHPSMIGQSIETDMFEQSIPAMLLHQRIVFANIWLFRPLLSWILSQRPTSNAVIRTVTAITMFNAGVKNNIIPPVATAIVNHRIHPAQTVAEVIEYDRAIIADSRVKIEASASMEPHPIAGYSEQDFGYQVLKTTVKQIWPESMVVPGVMLGNTDTFHYVNFTKNIYRFSPTYMYPGDPERFHGNNERISVKNYEQAINFFFHLIRNADQAGVTPTHKPHDDL